MLTRAHDCRDLLHQSIQVVIHFGIPKSQRPIALAFQERIAPRVAHKMLRRAMVRSVEFDDELCVVLHKVEYIDVKRRLLTQPEAESVQFTQFSP